MERGNSARAIQWVPDVVEPDDLAICRVEERGADSVEANEDRR